MLVHSGTNGVKVRRTCLAVEFSGRLTIAAGDDNDIGMEHSPFARTTLRVGHSTRHELDGIRATLAPLRFMVVAADYAVRATIAAHLETMGNIEVFLAGDFQTAQEECLAGRYDVVLLTLPGKPHSSLPLLSSLRAAEPVPVVVALVSPGEEEGFGEEEEAVLWDKMVLPSSRSQVLSVAARACLEAQWRSCRNLSSCVRPSRMGTDSLTGDDEEQVAAPAQYHLGEYLGATGMGAVYAGVDSHTDRPIVVRAVPRMLLERLGAAQHWWARFTREADAALAIGHPQVSSLLDYGLESGEQCVFLVAQRASGVSLAQRLKECVLSPEQALNMAISLCGGLSAIHGQNLVHGMVTAQSIFFGPGDEPTLTDLGLFGCLGRDYFVFDRPWPRPSCLAPEQVGCIRLDDRCDQFALGLVLYEAMTGRRCFPDESLEVYVHALLFGEPRLELPSSVADNEKLRATLRRMLARDRDDRYHDDEELRHALVRCRQAVKAAAL